MQTFKTFILQIGKKYLKLTIIRIYRYILVEPQSLIIMKGGAASLREADSVCSRNMSGGANLNFVLTIRKPNESVYRIVDWRQYEEENSTHRNTCFSCYAPWRV